MICNLAAGSRPLSALDNHKYNSTIMAVVTQRGAKRDHGKGQDLSLLLIHASAE